MRATTCTIALFLSLGYAAIAQDGGKLNWKGKGGDPQTAMLDARDQGKPILLFFTSEG